MYTTEFSNWLNDELRERDWSQAGLSRATGLTTAAISKIMSGERGLGKKSANSIARAFKMSPEVVYRIAGLLPPKSDSTPTLEEANFLLQQLDEDDQRTVIYLIRAIHDKGKKKYQSTEPRGEIDNGNLGKGLERTNPI
jgi:transcriptional regulator with XRE-family HTH domain